MLLHYPASWSGVGGPSMRKEAWLAMEEWARRTGKAKALGVSHYCKRHLEDVFLTGYAADWCDVPRVDSKSVHPQYPKLEKFDPTWDLHYHYILSRSKLMMFRMFNYDNLLAKFEKLQQEQHSAGG